MSVSREAGDVLRLLFAAIIRMLMLLVLSSVVVEATSRKLSAVSTQHVWMLRQVLRFLLRKNIDVIQWVEDPAEFIYNAIAPAEVDYVLFDEDDSKRATVVVPDNKLSLAIGRRGQNVRLAAHLTGYRIDIKSASEYEALEAEKAEAEVDEVVEEIVAEATPVDVTTEEAPEAE